MEMDSQKRQKYLLIVLAAVIVAGAAFLWISKRPSAGAGSSGQGENSHLEIEIENVDLSVLESEKFRNLIRWGESPKDAVINESGRDNPFIPVE